MVSEGDKTAADAARLFKVHPATISRRFLGQEVGEAEQALIREIVGTCGGLSRMELAATVGELLGWKRRRGSLKARECREFLEKLESQGGLVLPPKRRGRPPGKATEVPVTAGGEPGARLVGTARDLGEIRLQQVRTREQRRLFRELVGRYHYLGQRVPFGAHLRYLVYASEPAARVVACVQFSSAAWLSLCKLFGVRLCALFGAVDRLRNPSAVSRQ